jgi:branched-chain amino acid transport system ATP-binding protein
VSLLVVQGVSKAFGGLQAISLLDFAVAEGEIVGLIGPNGSGKTTTLNLLTGFLRPDSGTISFRGRDVTGLPPHRLCRLGVARTFQLVKPFLGFTALENVLVGLTYGRRAPQGRAAAERGAREVLERVGLGDRSGALAKDLTLMQRKRLELARALATGPELLLLDELMAGLGPAEARDACALVRQTRDAGVTILLVEHIVKVICGVSDRVIVLNMGGKIAEGRPDDVICHPEVVEVYLGQAHA